VEGLGGSIEGCRIRFNPRLLGDVGIPYSVECTGSWRIDSPRDAEEAARPSVTILSDLLKARIELGRLTHWEYIGRRFNLFSFSLMHGSLEVGELRVVETGGRLVNVSGTLREEANEVAAEEAVAELREKGELSAGRNLGHVYLRERQQASREPFGQKVVPRFVVYAAEGIQRLDPESWRLRIWGLVERELSYSYQDLLKLSREFGEADFHCVTGWSVAGRRWGGVPLKELLREAGVRQDARWVAARSAAGYSTVIPIEEALSDDALLATTLDGEPLPRDNGFPARLFLPRLYGWKAAKWVTEILVLDRYEDGLWEALGYHERGLVAAEERFKVRNPEIAKRGELPGPPRPLNPRQE
jgi:DMSO/TMAO reductase YedYZ molybdopterin-dependent catalytic subunit